MTRTYRPRRLAALALAGASALALAACSGAHPNTIFTSHTDFNVDVGHLFKILFTLATLVFILVEALLLFVIFRFRAKPGQAEPEHVHGNTTLEVLWTAIPAVILVFIAVPTVRTIFRTQAKARPDALNVEVVGHQWWWEFRYPQYTVRSATGKLDTLTTANELYIPVGRTVNFALKSQDVIHSFWIPALSGKRDVVPNHTNYLWFTPDAAQTADSAWNGHCAEYCGASHANMKFRTYTVTPAEFESWAQGQIASAAFGAAPAAPAAPAAGTPGATTTPTGTPTAEGRAAANTAAIASQANAQSAGPKGEAGQPALPPDAAARGGVAQAQMPGNPSPVTQVANAQPAGYVFPADKMPAHTIPTTPFPAGLAVNTSLQGDPARGQQVFSSTSCIGCHAIRGNPMAMGIIGPNLTHVGTRHTIAGGLFPNDTRHLTAWIKNARAMKPGVIMPTLGLNETDPITKAKVTTGGLTDQQIADIVAYLQALK